MSDCTTCKYANTCDTEIFCEAKELVKAYPMEGCSSYEERDDGLVLTQVWDWR